MAVPKIGSFFEWSSFLEIVNEFSVCTSGLSIFTFMISETCVNSGINLTHFLDS